jgi:GxxExxY protein
VIRFDDEIEALAHAVIGAAIEVHRELGPGYMESIYEQALCAELNARGVAFEKQVVFDVDYKGVKVGQGRLDLLVGGRLVVELKVVDKVLGVHKQQVVSYLKAWREPVGLLLNFHVERLVEGGIHRVIFNR